MVGRILVPAGALLCCFPFVSTGLGLLLGLVLALAAGTPYLARTRKLPPQLLALAIHDTSSVVGAAVAWGGKAVEIATTVKLARALWIVPLTIGIAWWHARTSGDATQGKPKRPWFIAGFLLAAALATYVPALREP